MSEDQDGGWWGVQGQRFSGSFRAVELEALDLDDGAGNTIPDLV